MNSKKLLGVSLALAAAMSFAALPLASVAAEKEAKATTTHVQKAKCKAMRHHAKCKAMACHHKCKGMKHHCKHHHHHHHHHMMKAK